eukprot:11885605-Karenia_brevis.AAC.1
MDTFRVHDGEIWLDGSCADPSDIFLARAGWSAVQLDPNGNLVKAVYGNVPGHIQQSAVNGEHMALKMGAVRCEDKNTFYVDCQAVISNHRKGP